MKTDSALLVKALDTLHLLDSAANLYYLWKYFQDISLRSKNERFIKQGAPDGLPLSSAYLVYLVTGQWDIEAFYNNGVTGAECVKNILFKNGLDINAFECILDFGCGCGRIMRNWKTLEGPKLHGTDYNPLFIKWCRRALSFAEFQANKFASRLKFDDNSFDFIYAISVFTHLTEKLQNFWITELKRVLRTGGYLLMTLHGKSRLYHLSQAEQELFETGRCIVKMGKYACTNRCGSFHPEKYVRQHLSKGLTVVDFVPDGAIDAKQDQYLLRKPS